MSVLIQYLVKLSISLAVVWLFYHFVLRKLTFYNSNRWYLLGYTLLSFLIPFINITPIVEQGQLVNSPVIRFIPAVETYTEKVERFSTCPAPLWSSAWDKWDWALLAISIGAAFLLMRFLLRCISYLQLRNKATLLWNEGMKIYHVDESIIPFSFGNAVFINRNLHDNDELQEIIHHEFVHVKQRHTADILWGELLCMLNWYNPFAWLLRADMRQNLEFIADNKVLENGVNKKEYQYLLLKVIGNNHFSIAQKFNFSSLKKRIAMMNKIKTARVHLLRFLFLLPLLAIILVSFRKQIGDTLKGRTAVDKLTQRDNIIDTVPSIQTPNEKGYYIDVIGVGGNCTVVVKDKNKKEVTRLLLNDWTKQEDYYEGLYGKIPPPPPPDPPLPPTAVTIATPPAPPVSAIEEVHGLDDFLKRNPEVKDVGFVFNKDNTVAIVHLIKKDGSEEKIDLRNESERKKGENKYGKFPQPSSIPPVPPAPPAPAKIAIASNDGTDKLATLCKDFTITDKKAIMYLKNGETEEYDLTKMAERRKFEKKYGRIINLGANGNGVAPIAIVNGPNGQTVLAPLNALQGTGGVLAMDSEGAILNGEEEILFTISKDSGPRQMEEFKKQMKEKGYELQIDNTEYENGVLVSVSGNLKFKDSHANFSATDFSKVIISVVSKSGRKLFKVNIVEKKVTI